MVADDAHDAVGRNVVEILRQRLQHARTQVPDRPARHAVRAEVRLGQAEDARDRGQYALRRADRGERHVVDRRSRIRDGGGSATVGNSGLDEDMEAIRSEMRRFAKAEVVDNDQVTIRQLPAPLQEILLKMQIGQATPPFGNPEEGVRTLVLCGRDDSASAQLPGSEQIQSQLEQQRVNLRAQQALRDLRRDAIVEYR